MSVLSCRVSFDFVACRVCLVDATLLLYLLLRLRYMSVCLVDATLLLFRHPNCTFGTHCVGHPGMQPPVNLPVGPIPKSPSHYYSTGRRPSTTILHFFFVLSRSLCVLSCLVVSWDIEWDIDWWCEFICIVEFCGTVPRVVASCCVVLLRVSLLLSRAGAC